MGKRKLLRRCINPGKYLNSNMKGLECLGRFVVYEDKTAELYKIPGSRDFGVIFSDGLVQVHPYEWHSKRALFKPSDRPFNNRIVVSDSDDSNFVIAGIADKSIRVALKRRNRTKLKRNRV